MRGESDTDRLYGLDNKNLKEKKNFFKKKLKYLCVSDINLLLKVELGL